jgi:hypothetical protein
MPETYHAHDPWVDIFFAAVARGMNGEEASAEADRLMELRKQEEEACIPSK